MGAGAELNDRRALVTGGTRGVGEAWGRGQAHRSLYGGAEYRFDTYEGLPDSHQTALTLGLRF